MASWLAECCEHEPGKAADPLPSSLFYSSWRTWIEAAGEHAGSQKRFTQAMVSRGYESERITKGMDKGKMGLRGLRFTMPPAANASDR